MPEVRVSLDGSYKTVRVDDGFDPRTYDFTANTGARVPLTQELTGRIVISGIGAGNLRGLSAAHIDSADGSWLDYFNNIDATASDLYVEAPVNVEMQAGLTGHLLLEYVKVVPTLQNQAARGARTGAVQVGGRVSHAEIVAVQDGIQGFAGPGRKIAEYVWVHGPGKPYYQGFTYGGGAPGTSTATTGKYMTPAQKDSVKIYQPGMTVQAGDFIDANVNGTHYAYEVVQGGTLETTSPWPNWPTKRYQDLLLGDTSQPFTSGTAKLVNDGQMLHSDGMQWVGGGLSDIRRVRVEGNSNSALFMASDASSGDHPLWSVHVTEALLTAGGNYVMYITAKMKDAYGTDAGGYLRNPDGTWVPNPTVYKARPWAMRIAHSYIGTYNGVVPSTDLLTGKTISGAGVFVRDEETWRQLVAAQYRLSPNDPMLDAMWFGPFDWTNDTPPVDQNVLEQRYKMGLNPGVCDMRGAVVWEDVRVADTDAQIHPLKSANGAGRDSQGYYIGG